MEASGVVVSAASALSQVPTNELFWLAAMFFTAISGFSAGYQR
jgi:hypothetical protein